MNLLSPVNQEDLAAVRAWFDTLANHCRAIDYEVARPIFAEDMIAFGTFTDFMKGRDLAEHKQWRNVWGTIRNFRYDLDKIEAIVSADRLTAVGMGVWQSDGFHPNGVQGQYQMHVTASYNGQTATANITQSNGAGDRKSTRLNSSHRSLSRMPSSA